MTYQDAPQILREFLSYHETIKAQSPKTISEYYLDLRMFLRFMKLMRDELPYQTDLDTIDIRGIDLKFLAGHHDHRRLRFFVVSGERPGLHPDSPGVKEHGLGASARARKLSAIKSFYKYLTVRTKQLEQNPVKDLEFPKLRKSLPHYLTLEQSTRLLEAVRGPNATRDYAILMLFLNCGIRRRSWWA